METLPPLLARYPRITPEWHFENRPVDLIAENYDAAIGGAFDLAPVSYRVRSPWCMSSP